jgi:tetratricopeptide (TPR) repeat protein
MLTKRCCFFFLMLCPLAGQTAWQADTSQGAALERAGRYSEADTCYRRALAQVEALEPPAPLALASALHDLASLQLLMGRPSQAEPLYRRAYDLRAGALSAGDPRIGVTLHGLAEAVHQRRRYAEAEDLYRRAAAILESAYGPPSLALADVRHNWAALYRETRRDAQARPLLEGADSIYEKVSPLHAKRAIVLRNLAELEASAGRTRRAQELFDHSLEICAAALPAGHPQTGVILQAYARFLKDTHRSNEARIVSQRARAILGTAYTVDASAFR